MIRWWLDYLAHRRRAEAHPESLAFDAEHGLETAQFAMLSDYEPIPPSLGEALLDVVVDALGPRTKDAIFVDVGCGKGRMLALASRRAFARVIGVERDRALARRCGENLALWYARYPGLPVPELYVEDAAEFRYPAGERVLYLYNPFGPDVLVRVLGAVRAPGTWLLYANPAEEELVAGAGFVAERRGGEGDLRWVLFRWPAPRQ